MNTILISVIIGAGINFVIWALLTIIAILSESKHEKFLIGVTFVSGVIALITMAVYVIYNLILF